MGRGSLGFQSLMYYKFIIKKQYRVDETAFKMRIAMDTLYRYIRGELIIPPDRIVDLIKATGDREFLEFFSDPAGFDLVPRETFRDAKDIRALELNLAISVGQALKEIEKAYEDGKIEESEYRTIHRILSNLRTETLKIEKYLKKGK